MIDLRRFLRLLDSVLAEGPTRAPEDVVRSVVAVVRTTPRPSAHVARARRALVQLLFAVVTIAVLGGLVLVSR